MFISNIHTWPSLYIGAVSVQQDIMSVCPYILFGGVGGELSCLDTNTDPILPGTMTMLFEWLPEYSNEVILPQQMMKNSCYELVLVHTALRNFICCLIFLLASSAGAIVWLEQEKNTHLGLKAQCHYREQPVDTATQVEKSVCVCAPLRSVYEFMYCSCTRVPVCVFSYLWASVCETQGSAGERMHTEC